MGRAASRLRRMALTARDVRAWVEVSCVRQGLAPRVTDPAAVRRVAVLAQAELNAPDRHDPRLIEPVPSTHSGANRRVVENGRDDRLLPAERQGWPRSA